MNCKWFLLRDPQTINIGSIKNETITNLIEKVNNYRKNCFINNLDYIKQNCDVAYVFGGCGGNPRDIINLVVDNL